MFLVSCLIALAAAPRAHKGKGVSPGETAGPGGFEIGLGPEEMGGVEDFDGGSWWGDVLFLFLLELDLGGGVLSRKGNGERNGGEHSRTKRTFAGPSNSPSAAPPVFFSFFWELPPEFGFCTVCLVVSAPLL